MKSSFASSAVIVATVLAFVALPSGAASQTTSQGLDAMTGWLDSWYVQRARETYDQLEPRDKDSPRGHYLAGRMLMCEGRFEAALEELGYAIEGAKAEIQWKGLRQRVAESEDVAKGLVVRQGPSGVFVFRYAPGPDEVLVPYADRVLLAQREALAATLGERTDAPLEVFILPSEEALAAMSGLTVEQIQRTGTVGVSKYGRIMILSPAQLVTGYPWLVTLAHELTHVVITRASRNEAPVWLHEGIAKLLESHWQSNELGSLTPEEAYLLDRAAVEGRLIPLRGFHPSVAHLPNQEDAALAYAQGLSFVEYLASKLGDHGLKELLAALGRGEALDAALVALCKFDLKRLYAWWKQSVRGKRQTPVPAVQLMTRRFKRGQTTGEAEIEALLDQEVRRFLRVGDLLRLRGHTRAAIIEYERARERAESPLPEITDRLAGVLLDVGEARKAAALLPEIAELYPLHGTTFVQLGLAQAVLGNNEAAARNLERAIGLNPFHHEVHCVLADIYTKLERADGAALEESSCRLLVKQVGGASKKPRDGVE